MWSRIIQSAHFIALKAPSKKEYFVTMLSPAVLATIAVLGTNLAQNVTDDIRRQTSYGINFSRLSLK